MMNRVSILIPCYNSEQYLAQAIHSAIDQTWINKEIIIVNDGSTDRSAEIAESFISDTVKVYTQPNSGACRARNLAFEMSSGDYIQYLDADDLLPKEKIECQMQAFKDNDNRLIASTSWQKFNDIPQKTSAFHSPLFKDYEQPLQLLLDMWSTQEMMQTSVWLTPRLLIEKAGKWDETLTVNQDGEFFCRVLLAAKGVKFFGQTYSLYRAGVSGSVSNASLSRRKASSLLKSYLSYEKEVFKNTDSTEVKKALAMNYYAFIYLFDHLYADLAKIAKNRVNEWAIPPPRIGSSNFKKIAGILGFNTTLQLRRLFSARKEMEGN